MGSCKMKGKTRCNLTLRHNPTGKIVSLYFNRRMTHNKPGNRIKKKNANTGRKWFIPRTGWIRPDDRKCTSKTFDDGMKHAWFRREVMAMILQGRTLSEVKKEFNES